MRSAIGLVVLVGVLALGCSSDPKPVPKAPDTRGAALLQALRNPDNTQVPSAWDATTEQTIVRHAQSTCADLRAEMPLADVWQKVMTREGIGTIDAGYFTTASAKLYCPQYQREAGE